MRRFIHARLIPGALGVFLVGILLVALGLSSVTAKPPEPAEIERLIRQLGNEKFTEREAARRALDTLGEAALDALEKGAADTDTDIEVRFRARSLAQTIIGRLSRELRRFESGPDAGWIYTVTFSPDGRHALTGHGYHKFEDNNQPVEVKDCSLRLWDVGTGKELRRFTGHQSTVQSAVFFADGRQVLSGCAGGGLDSTVRLWDTTTGKEIRRYTGHEKGVCGVALSPDGRRAVSGGGTVRYEGDKLDKLVPVDCGLQLWDVQTGKMLRRFEGHQSTVISLAFSPDGRRILSGSHDGTLRLWDAETGRQVRLLVRELAGEVGVNQNAFSSDGRRVLSCGMDPTVRLWDTQTGKELLRLEGPPGWVQSVALSPDGRRILTGGGGDVEVPLDCAVRLWDVATGTVLRRFEGHTKRVMGVAFSPDGRHALSGGLDRTMRLWLLPR